MQHPELMDDRESTGYNTMVRNYCKLIEKTGVDANEALKDVREYLFNESYSQQAEGLIKALQKSGVAKNNGTKLKTTEIKKLIKNCMMYSEETYEIKLGNLLVVE